MDGICCVRSLVNHVHRLSSVDTRTRRNRFCSSSRLVIVIRLEPHQEIVVRTVTLDLVGYHLLDSLFNAMYDQSMSCLYQREWFPDLPRPLDVAKPCRSVEYPSMEEALHSATNRSTRTLDSSLVDRDVKIDCLLGHQPSSEVSIDCVYHDPELPKMFHVS